MAKSFKIVFSLLLIAYAIIGCSSDKTTWNDDQKNEFKREFQLSGIQKFVLSKEMTETYTNYCIDSLTNVASYSAISQMRNKEIDGYKHLIDQIRSSSWERILRENEKNLNNKGIEVVFPDSLKNENL